MSSESPKPIAGSPRAWLPLFSIYEDSVVTGRGGGSDEVYKAAFEDRGSTDDTVIDRYWNDPDNRDVVDAFMNNKLCVDAAQGKPEAIAAYKKYAVQDYFYLVDWFKFRVLRLATLTRDSDDLELGGLSDELNSVHKALGAYVTGWYKLCLKPEKRDEDEGEDEEDDEKYGLGLGLEDFQVERTIAELAYSQYILNNARSDGWYNLHIILVGCYWGWSKLALKLYNDPRTDRSTIFYKFWIAGSVDSSANPAQMSGTAKALSSFLDQNQQVWSSQTSNVQAKEIFRTVLRLEVGLFNSAYDASVKKGALCKAPAGGLPLPPGGVHRRHAPRKNQEWRSLLGLESERDNTDEDGSRIRKP